MKHLWKSLILILACSLTLVGCWDQKTFEQVALILSFGIESSENDKLLLSYAYPPIESTGNEAVDVFSTESSLVRGGRTNLTWVSSKRIEGGKVQQVLISEELAKQGIHDLLELFQRDVTLPAVAFVAIVEGSPFQLLKQGAEFKTKQRISYYIYQLLENNVELSNIPNTKVFDFDINYFAPGLDPIAPIIKVDHELIKITGCALFDDDKMTGRLENHETNLLLGMMEQLKNTEYMIDEPDLKNEGSDKHGIAINLFHAKRKTDINFNEEGIPIIEINMNYHCSLDEYKWDNTLDAEMQKILEVRIEEHLNGVYKDIIRKLQEANCGPIGIGDLIRAKYSEYYQEIDWKEIYPEAKIKVTTEVDIRTVGVIK